jgi:hypothetical protein
MVRRFLPLFFAFVIINLLAAGIAEANGTLRVTFKLKNPDGSELGLENAYVYLQKGEEPPPMEKFFSKPEYILGPTNTAGYLSTSVPPGEYFVRITRRKNTPYTKLGPPEPDDYSWTPVLPILITSGMVTDLGTQYAELFGVPIRISGVVKHARFGNAMENRYVRAQSEPCIQGDPTTWPNYCGPDRFPAQLKTDANGAYTILLKDPGVYYLSVSQFLGLHSYTLGGIGPITVSAGDDLKIDILSY